jgi:hypothetical protein
MLMELHTRIGDGVGDGQQRKEEKGQSRCGEVGTRETRSALCVNTSQNTRQHLRRKILSVSQNVNKNTNLYLPFYSKKPDQFFNKLNN